MIDMDGFSKFFIQVEYFKLFNCICDPNMQLMTYSSIHARPLTYLNYVPIWAKFLSIYDWKHNNKSHKGCGQYSKLHFWKFEKSQRERNDLDCQFLCGSRSHYL